MNMKIILTTAILLLAFTTPASAEEVDTQCGSYEDYDNSVVAFCNYTSDGFDYRGIEVICKDDELTAVVSFGIIGAIELEHAVNPIKIMLEFGKVQLVGRWHVEKDSMGEAHYMNAEKIALWIAASDSVLIKHNESGDRKMRLNFKNHEKHFNGIRKECR